MSDQAPSSGGFQKSWTAYVLEWVEIFVFALTAVIFILTFCLTTVRVDGGSMEPTLWDGDMLLATPYTGHPQRGDIVVIAKPYMQYDRLIKRVIGLPGEEVDINFATGEVSIDGRVLDESYTISPTVSQSDVQFPLIVPEGQVFVLGDNREHSSDSRVSDIGTMDISYLRGSVYFRLFPLHRIGIIS